MKYRSIFNVLSLKRVKHFKIVYTCVPETHKCTCLSVDVKTELQGMRMGSNTACELLPNQLVGTECPGHQMPYLSLQCNCMMDAQPCI